MYSCTFIGHKDCFDDIKPVLYETIEYLILKENVSCFYVGTHGNFDKYVYETLSLLRKKYEIKVFVVLAYLNNNKHCFYNVNDTIYPCVLEKVPLRYAINKRNMYMIEQSQFMLCYVNHTFSNSYRFLVKAVNKNLKVLNIGKYKIEFI